MKNQVTKSKILVVLGPTATGKSDFAVELAKRFNGEIISADSRQVYKGMDLGTGKITKPEMQGIPHHMLDIISPKTVYNVSKYKIKVQKIIADILKRNKLPIICGGTGFYIDAVVKNIALPEVKPNPKLREKLEKKDIKKLLEILQKLDKNSAQKIDRKNKRKIIRAIEIATALGAVPPIKSDPLYNTLEIGLIVPDKKLKERIYLRLVKRLEAGMLREGEKLHKQDLSFKRMEDLGLEYRYMGRYLSKKITKEQMIDQLYHKIWQFARRQKTWFRRNKNIIWLNPLKKGDIKKAEKVTEKFLKK